MATMRSNGLRAMTLDIKSTFFYVRRTEKGVHRPGDTLRNRKEQLLRVAYLTEARNGAHVTNYLARQVLESAGKLPAVEPTKQ